jgi:hypothetical protein
MLAGQPIDVMLMATDLGTAKQFYGDRIGLRARGLEVVDYDGPGITTTDGVADVGVALAAWFVDPGGTTIGLLLFKGTGLG